jgi:hypothetical protein
LYTSGPLSCSLSLDEVFKSSSYLTETLLDPEFGHATEPTKTALNKTFGFEGDMWSWFEEADNKSRLGRFGAAMASVANMTPADAILEGLPFAFVDHRTLPDLIHQTGYSWETLPPGSLVVDVGGGVGSQSLTLARHHPNLRFVVQDRDAVIGDANEVRCTSVLRILLLHDSPLTQYWKKNMPEALDSGRVKLLGLTHFIPAFPGDED